MRFHWCGNCSQWRLFQPKIRFDVSSQQEYKSKTKHCSHCDAILEKDTHVFDCTNESLASDLLKS